MRVWLKTRTSKTKLISTRRLLAICNINFYIESDRSSRWLLVIVTRGMRVVPSMASKCLQWHTAVILTILFQWNPLQLMINSWSLTNFDTINLILTSFEANSLINLAKYTGLLHHHIWLVLGKTALWYSLPHKQPDRLVSVQGCVTQFWPTPNLDGSNLLIRILGHENEYMISVKTKIISALVGPLGHAAVILNY